MATVWTNSPRDGDPSERGEPWGPEEHGEVSLGTWDYLRPYSLGRAGEGMREYSGKGCAYSGKAEGGRRRNRGTFVARSAEARQRPYWYLLRQEDCGAGGWLEGGGRLPIRDEDAKRSGGNDHKEAPTPLQRHDGQARSEFSSMEAMSHKADPESEDLWTA